MAAETTGLFAEWQPRYAEQGIATFPVRDKKPAVRGYLLLGAAASSKLVEKFAMADALGIALERAGIVVVDVDTPDERVLVEALDRHGDTPFVVRSGGGNFHAWYRRRNEARRVRPDKTRPIDILGRGFVLAPPSAGGLEPYRIIQGTLADLSRLPYLKNAPVSRTALDLAVAKGRRNDTLWRRCMAQARYCDDLNALLDVARTANGAFEPPLPDEEVTKLAQSAWGYTERGENWFGGAVVAVPHDEIDGLLYDDPDAFILLTILRRNHWGREFVVANAMADCMPKGGWTRKRLADARDRLARNGLIEMVRAAGRGLGPARYRLKGGQF